MRIFYKLFYFFLLFFLHDTLNAQCTCSSGNPGVNLIVNPDFSAGNTGFTNSYTYCNSSNCLGPPEYYAVGSDASFFHSLFVGVDHTTGTGNFMIINGSSNASMIVWSQTISVTTNTDYLLTGWVSTVYPSDPAQVQFCVNGDTLGAVHTASLSVNDWTQFCTTWNSGSATSATVMILSQSTSFIGNDFGLDDIVMQSCTPCAVNISASSDTTICNGSTVNLFALPDTAYTYSWSPVTGLNSSSVYNPDATPSNTTTYTVTASIGLCSDEDSVTITVNPLPPVTVSSDTMICLGSSANLTANGADTYNWAPSNGLNTSTGSFVTSTPVNTITYTVSGTNTTTGCLNVDSVRVTVKPLPIQPVNADWIICFGDTLSFNFPGWTLIWGSNQVTLPTQIVAQQSQIYTVTMVDTNSCYDPVFSVSVNVNSLPYVNAGNDTVITSGDLLMLNGNGNGTLFWTESSGMNTLSCDTCSDPIVNPEVGTTYYLTVTDANGCSDMDSVYIEVDDQLVVYIPNAFTPNADNNDDLFFAKGSGIANIQMLIFNRWGEKLIETEGYESGWDGTYKGVPAESGVYVYSINVKSINGNSVKRIGHFTLIR